MSRRLSTGEAAKRLGVSVDVVRSLEERGELKAIRTAGDHRRFRAEEVDALQAKWRRTQTGPGRNAARGAPPAQPRYAQPPVQRQHPAPSLDPDIEHDLFDPSEVDAIQDVADLRAIQHAKQEAARRQAAADAKAREAAAQPKRLEALKKYGQELATWAFLPPDWQGRVVTDLESFVTRERFPSWVSDQDAREIVKARIETTIKRYRDEQVRRAEEEKTERQIDELITYGKNYAYLETLRWDPADRDTARREVSDALEENVSDDWTKAEAKALVDEILAEWEDETES